jgi:Fe-S cluster assembly protein SufD
MNNPNQPTADTLHNTWQNRNPGTPDWLQTLQKSALAEFAQTGFPNTRMEDWKYTDVRKLAEAYPQWLVNQVTLNTDATSNSLEIDHAIRVVFIDGIYNAEQSTQNLPEYIQVGKLSELATKCPEILKNNLGKLAKNSDSGFVAVNTAFSETAITILVPENTELQQPIQIEYFSSAEKTSVQPRVLAALGTNSRATIVEHFSSTVPVITNAVTEVYCSPGSDLTYYRLQEEYIEAWHTAAQYIHLDHDASVNAVTIDTGALQARNEMRLCLAGPRATADVKGLLLADGSRHIDSRLSVEHAAPDTRSRERYRSILADKARGVFNGRILVQQEAQKTAAQLTNRNLLLNPGAEINTKPELEIYADDVKCAHGATTGKLDETSMFYLLSRGIDPVEARNILVTAFASELLTDIQIPAVVEHTQNAMRALRFGQL